MVGNLIRLPTTCNQCLNAYEGDDMSEFKFEKGATVLFSNQYGLLTDGQIRDRWTDEYGAWYEVYDLSDPYADQHPRELHEDSLRAVR